MASPSLVVFDLDECVWHPEMYTLDEVPTDDAAHRVVGPLAGGTGVVGVRSGSATIALYPGALKALQELHAGKYPDMRAATASSADTPHAVAIGRAALSILEVVPGVTVRQVLARGFAPGFGGNLQIGRTPPLSSNKAETHFPILKRETGVPYNGMLFFDDCNWGDHCTKVARGCKGVVAQKTPHGMTEAEWAKGLKKFAEAHSGSA